MRYIVLSTMVVALAIVGSGLAQPYYPPGPPPDQPRMTRGEASAIARYWIKAYLRRGASPEEIRSWAEQLVAARVPADTLAALLSSPEYLNYAGGSRRGLIRQLVLDVGHHEPSRGELEDRLRRTASLSAREIAYGFLREFPGNWWPGPLATPPPELEHLYPTY